jgi:beta-mannanase
MKKIVTAAFALLMAMDVCASDQTEQLKARLVRLQERGIMIGHQDDPFYGTTWKWDLNRSDVKEVCGQYPAVMGFELGQIELDSTMNLDGVPFKRMRDEIVAQHMRGGIITISWHAWNPVTGKNAWDPSGRPVKEVLCGGSQQAKMESWLAVVADFLKSLKTAGGEPIPVIFRPWHEMHGGWFWWGKDSCTPEEYQHLFRHTVKMLSAFGVDNCLYCYSPGGSPNETEESFMKFYPGDEYVDMIGVDLYSGTDRQDYINKVKNEFEVIAKVAAKHGKLVCFAETGQRDTTDPQWFTQALWEAIKDVKMSYVLLWRNAWDQKTENFGPAPEKACADDFRQLFAQDRALFVNDLVDEDYKARLQLEQRLRTLQQRGYMYGHQDDPFYGLTWEWDYGKSDILALVGDYPAVMGFDLGGIEKGDAKNLDSVPFTRIHDELLAHVRRGGIVTISWHPRNPLTGGTAWDVSSDQVVKSILPGGSRHELFKVWMKRICTFLKTLKNEQGDLVPVIFRPWHENNGSWFWWGQKLCSDEEYLALWNLLQDYLTGQGLTNLLWSYSPNLDGGWTEERFLKRYPGNDRVTLIGEDAYQWGTEEDFVRQCTSDLDFISSFASRNGKLFALTECGYKNIPDATWWTRVLKPVMDKYQLSYFLTWRNNKKEYFGPAPKQISAKDFKKLYKAKNTLFLKDIQ